MKNKKKLQFSFLRGNHKLIEFRLVNKSILAILISVFSFTGTVHASTVLSLITQDELDRVHGDLANLMIFTTMSSGAPFGNEDTMGFGVELGIISGASWRDGTFKDVASGASETDAAFPVLPVALVTLGVSLPGHVTVEGIYRPRLKDVGIDYGFFRTFFSGFGARWTFSSFLPVKPLNIDIGANYSVGEFGFGQTLDSIPSDINMDRRIFGVGSTIGAEFSFFRPYIYLGYAKSMMDITATNGFKVFSSSLTTTGSASSDIDSFVGRVGVELRFPVGSLGLEYQRAFSANRITVKASGHFP